MGLTSLCMSGHGSVRNVNALHERIYHKSRLALLAMIDALILHSEESDEVGDIFILCVV